MASSRVQHYTLTLTGAPDELPNAVGGGKIRRVELTADPANTNPVYIGGMGSQGVLTTANWGGYMPAPVTSIPHPPYVIEGFTDGTHELSDYKVLGTLNEKVHILYHPFI